MWLRTLRGRNIGKYREISENIGKESENYSVSYFFPPATISIQPIMLKETENQRRNLILFGFVNLLSGQNDKETKVRNILELSELFEFFLNSL